MEACRRAAVLSVVGLVLAVPASALGQAPTESAYDSKDVVVVGGAGDPGDPADPGDPTGTATADPGTGGGLPFTGLDVALLAAAGAALAAFGLGMRLLTRGARGDTA